VSAQTPVAEQIPENVYFDAALALVIAQSTPPIHLEWTRTQAERISRRRDHRAAVESAYRAGRGRTQAESVGRMVPDGDDRG